jgi:hypothetical protein
MSDKNLKESIKANKEALSNFNTKTNIKADPKNTPSARGFMDTLITFAAIIGIPALMIGSILSMVKDSNEQKYLLLEKNIEELVALPKKDTDSLFRTEKALFSKGTIEGNDVYILEKAKSFVSHYSVLCYNIQEKTNKEYFNENKSLAYIPFDEIKSPIGCYLDKNKEENQDGYIKIFYNQK